MERTKAQETANLLHGIKLYEQVIKVLQRNDPLEWGSVLEDNHYQLPDQLRPELIRFFGKSLEYHVAKLQEL